MGLDMYLEVRRSTRTTDWTPQGEKFVNQLGRDILDISGLRELAGEESYYVTTETTAIYWRKVNAIHKWFVDNIGGGVDECQRMYVKRKDLEDLRDLVKDVLIHRDKASIALPTESGFFFGNTEYDQWYWSDLEYTARELDRVLANTRDTDDFYYQASW
jgi:hypothetical protein